MEHVQSTKHFTYIPSVYIIIAFEAILILDIRKLKTSRG